jgi:hypothetical protein
MLDASEAAALELCFEEPRLLLPASPVLVDNFRRLAAALAEYDLSGLEEGGGGGGDSSGLGDGGRRGGGPDASGAAADREAAARRVLRAWARRAPLLLARRAEATAARLAELGPEFASAAPGGLRGAAEASAVDPATVLRWAARDPRILLTRRGAAAATVVDELTQSLKRHPYVTYALAAAHPSYLVMLQGALRGWADDVAHLLQVPRPLAVLLAGDPEVGVFFPFL